MSSPSRGENLPGLERLLEVCHRLKRSLLTEPPGHVPPIAGTRIRGHALDPMLAAFYARFGKAVFAADVAGMGLFQFDDTVNELEAQNREWQSSYQEQLPIPLFVFGGEPGLAYSYVTVPGLADAEGRQPVLLVDLYEEPRALPIASNVDRFFLAYSRYLEALQARPEPILFDHPLVFPWDVADVLARDERLVELMRAGHFDSLMRLHDESVRRFVGEVTGTHGG